MTLVSGNTGIRCMRIFVWVPLGGGRQMTVESSTIRREQYFNIWRFWWLLLHAETVESRPVSIIIRR